ncbi:hypothetical protein [Nonomuraea aridisoli]|uniref:hypothetical protein n=1 Tax=Nonomuraea aridisoli TaxID=2070368 RepID=UPI0011B9481C|nr:hypothetical protein [Nonomuraea aridisoli]
MADVAASVAVRMTSESPEDGVANDRHPDACAEMRRGGVVWLAYAFAARHLIRLMVPALLVFLPIGLLAVVALALLVDGSAAVVNGDFELIGTPGPPLLAWSVAVLVVSMAGQAVALPATVMLAAGRLVGKDVSTSRAMRAAARRWPTTMALALVGVVTLAAVLTTGVGMLLWTGEQATAYTVMVALVLTAMPALLAVAPVVLEGRSARGALARAYRLTAGASFATPLTLVFGVVFLPALAARATDWALSEVPMATVAAGSVLALLIVPFQAAVITRLFLHRLAIKGTTPEFQEIITRLPEGEPRPIRPVPVLSALLLPSLLYAGAVLINPLGWLEVSETAVTEDWSRDPGSEVSAQDGRARPELDPSDLRVLQAGQGGRMVMLMDGFGPAKLLTCMDSSCTQTRFTWAEPPDVAGRYTAAGARLADGRLVMSTWAQEGVNEDGPVWDEKDWRARLGLLICDAMACVPAPGGKPVTEVTSSDHDRTVALAARPGGGLLVAHLYELSLSESNVDREALLITTCEDPSCTRPRTKEVAKVPAATYPYDKRGLVVGVGPDDRPVVLRFDRDTGSIFVISCADPACAQTRIGRPVRADWPYYIEGGYDPAGAAMVIRPDGLPMIAYRDVTDGAIKLLDCRTRECSQDDTATVSESGRNAGPAMALDQDGRALVAYQDLDRERIVVATCTGTRCTRTPVTTIRRGGEGLAMALDGRGRPTIAWIDVGGWNDWDLVVTRPLTLS